MPKPEKRAKPPEVVEDTIPGDREMPLDQLGEGMVRYYRAVESRNPDEIEAAKAFLKGNNTSSFFIVGQESAKRTRVDVVNRVRELRRQGLDNGRIAGRLNDEGFTKIRGGEFNTDDIRSMRRTHRIP